MGKNILQNIVEFAWNQAHPVVAVAVIFTIGFIFAGVPMQVRSGSVARDVWGTAAGVSLSLIYLIFIFGIKHGPR